MTESNWTKIRRELHQIPELGFKEYKTQQYILDYVQKLPQNHIEVTTWKTGVLVFVNGTVGEKTVTYRADIDGLPIHEQTGYDFASQHEGRMHACGHDFHMTIALGALTQVVEERVENHVLFVFQPAEEGPGGAQPMLASDEMNQYDIDYIFALHIDPKRPVGTVASKEGLLFANTSELFIDFHGQGGHAAYPHETKDMMMAASAFNIQLQQVVGRMVNPLEDAVVTLGKMEAGTVQNIIPETARVEGTIRTTKAKTMPLIKASIERILKGIEERYDCRTAVDYGANYYMVDNDSKYVEQFRNVLEGTEIEFVEAEEAMTGEDFGYMLKELPGFMFWLGVDSPYGLHHSQLKPKEDAIEVGIEAVVRMIES
ncbi:N-acetyldiaminopimelate deacetylase [Alkalibacillus aidingensis]|uniref:N-acetyldiaminopimelate deacetylase n=1 Tax=Alkalibacillus aidingensis TaxID=2747607 RepID=UPI0016603AA1|nr:N-acetyldiaminopimelate deacetylase [Alkalibacillus aidingensis]